MKTESISSHNAPPTGKTPWDTLATSPENNLNPADRFRVNPDNYTIFTQQDELDDAQGNNEKHLWNIDKTLHTYANRTAELIATIDGTSIEYENHPEKLKPDHIIYLDKSARPVSWLVNTFWQDLSDQPRPEHSYLNIDRLDWFERMGLDITPTGYISDNNDRSIRLAKSWDFKIDQIPQTDIARLRALYLPGGIEDENIDTIMNTPASLDGKNILIVDEVKNSGSTLAIAKQLIEAAFPDAKVDTTCFWHSGTKTSADGEMQMLSAPAWYNDKITEGRGIGEIEPEFFAQRFAENPTPRNRARLFGAIALSRPIDLSTEKNQLSRRLMQDIQQMHQDFKQGHILLSPNNYDDDRLDALIEAQGLQLLPATSPAPNNFIRIKNDILNRPPKT